MKIDIEEVRRNSRGLLAKVYGDVPDDGVTPNAVAKRLSGLVVEASALLADEAINRGIDRKAIADGLSMVVANMLVKNLENMGVNPKVFLALTLARITDPQGTSTHWSETATAARKEN